MMETYYKVGQLIGGEYQIEEILGGKGKSGMGDVYLVTHREYDLPFVLKTFQKEIASDALKQRFTAEITMWVNLGIHPNIVRAHWVRDIEQRIFIASEYISKDSEGRNTLSDYINQGPVPLPTVLNWGTQYCYGMEHALGRGLTAHRDIKPENLMVNPNGELKITDFGIVKSTYNYDGNSDTIRTIVLFEEQEVAHTKAGQILGSLLFMAPEQFEDLSKVDHRADIYAFGLILFMLISGKFPYRIENSVSAPLLFFYKIHKYSKLPSISSSLEPIIKKCTAKDPSNRYQKYEELRKDLVGLAGKTGTSIPKPRITEDDRIEEYYIKAQSFVMIGKPDEALKNINKYIEYRPDEYPGWTEKGKICLETNRLEEALVATKKSIELFGANSHSWNNLGNVYYRQKEYDDAINAYKKALEFDPYNTGAMMNMGVVYVEMKNFKASIQTFITALKINPSKDTLLFNARNAATAMLNSKAVNEATILFETLYEIDPNNTQVLNNLAISYEVLQKIPQAIKMHEKLLTIEKCNSISLLTLSKMYGWMRQIDKAIECCDRLIECKQEVRKAVLFKIQLLSYKGKHDTSIALLEKLIIDHPKDDDLYFILSDIYERKEDYNSSLNTLEECLAIVNTKTGPGNEENKQMILESINRIKRKL